ncbi:MAG: hydroxyacid dehydrogenase [Candidatus Altiarchaeota archaeon]|nr:hydroxyacid dehydrogenase [Candidatus Altiarchaeota archaeon]
MKARILAASKIHESALELAKEYAEVDVKTGLSEDELAKIMGDYDAIVVRSKPKVTKAMIDAGTKLKVIGRAGVGLDNVDKEAAAAKGVKVVNAPEASTISVAEHAIALMLSVYRDIPKARDSLKQGRWDRKLFMGCELYGKTLGLIGFGRIGKEVAKRARAFGMEVIVSDPAISSEDAKEYNAKCVEINEVFKTADIISIHVPALPTTKDLVNKERLAMMKPTAIIVNTSRGHAIDEDALYEALNEKKIKGAGLDVYKKEPLEGSPLPGLDNAVCVPHLGANTDEAQIMAGKIVIEKIREILTA